jgi:hypothetical protein
MKNLTRRGLLGVTAVVAGLAKFAPGVLAAEKAAGPCPLAGTWTYRSFLNDPDPAKAFNDLQFAVADVTIQEAEFGVLSGRLSFGDDYLKLTGTITYGNPFALRFQGVGATPGTIEDGHPWVYDYQGYVAPAWPNGLLDNPPAIVGTIVRTVPHSQGKAKAGFVASFIALRRDESKGK